MAKHSGIRALNNIKNKIANKDREVNTQRVVVAKKPESDTNTGAPVVRRAKSSDYSDQSVISDRFDGSESQNTQPDDQSGRFDEGPFGNRPGASRFGQKKKRSAGRIIDRLKKVFRIKKSKDKNSDALEFASNTKRLGKKGRRNKMIFMYAGTGLVVIAVLLLVFMVPGGEAAPAENQPTPASSSTAAAQTTQSPAETTAAPSVSANAAEVPTDSAATPTGSASTETPSTIAVIESIGGAAANPTTEPTIEPTEKPTEDSTEEPTEEPTPIPTTEPDPTPPPIDIDELVDFFKVEADAYYNEIGYSNNHYNYTEEEFYVLAQIIDIEAHGESFEGKIAVGNVVMNRVLCRSFPGSTITEVVTRAGQFAYNAGRTPSGSSKRAARAVLDDENWIVAQDVYYFRSGAAAGESWGSHPFYTQIGGHCFYTHSYSGRKRGGDPPPALFERTYKYAQYGCKPEKRVYRVQYMLNGLGYDVYADSYFGEGTKVALMAFQESKGLEADGVAGPATVKALIKEFGTEDYYYRFCA